MKNPELHHDYRGALSLHGYFPLMAGLLILMAGCVSPQGTSGPPEVQQQALAFTPPPGMAAIYVMAPFPLKFNFDYQDFGPLSYKGFFYEPVPAGRHSFCVGSLVNNCDRSLGYYVTSLNLEAGKNYFYEVKTRWKKVKFEQIPDDSGEKEVRRLTLANDLFDPQESTILMKLNIPAMGTDTRQDVNGWSPNMFLQVLDLQTKTIKNWMVRDGWAIGYARPGRYLLMNCHKRSLESNGQILEQNLEIRCEIVVPRSDVTVYFGAVSQVANGGLIDPTIDASVRDFYDHFVPFKRSALIAGSIKPESQPAGNQ